MKRLLLTISAALIALPVASFAGQVTYDLNSTPATGSIPTTEADWTLNLALPKFNAQLGTLTGVEWTLTNILSGTVSGTNTDASAQDFTSRIRAKVTGSFSNADCSIGCSVLVNNQEQFNDTGVGVGQTISHNVFERTATGTSALLTEQSLLDALTGTGFYQLAVTAQGLSFVSSGGNFDEEHHSYAGAQASITYFYDEAPVSSAPEPGTWALLGASLVGIGFAKRRATR